MNPFTSYGRTHFIGTYQVGDRLPLTLQAVAPSIGAGSPLAVSLVTSMVAKTYNSAGTLKATVNIPIKDRHKETSFFQDSHLLDATNYSVGRYNIVYQVTGAGTVFQTSECFDVVAGGDGDGQVISMANVQRPEGQHVLYETESGDLNAGRKPS